MRLAIAYVVQVGMPTYTVLVGGYYNTNDKPNWLK